MIIDKRFVACCIVCRQQFVLFEYKGMPGAQYSDHQCPPADDVGGFFFGETALRRASYGQRPFDPTEQGD